MMPRRLTEGGSAPLQGSRLGWQWRSWRGGDVIESLCMQLPRHGDSMKGAQWRSWRGGDGIESLCMQLPRHGDSIKGAGWGGSGVTGRLG
jgi:hypothetical protein